MTQDIKIFMNNNADMSKGKYAAHAVHAALNAAGIKHDAVVVLGGPKKLVESLNTVIHDAGRTELKPGTLTAGTDWTPAKVSDSGLSEEDKLIIKEAAETLSASSAPFRAVGENKIANKMLALSEKLADLLLADLL